MLTIYLFISLFALLKLESVANYWALSKNMTKIQTNTYFFLETIDFSTYSIHGSASKLNIGIFFDKSLYLPEALISP